MSLFGSGNNNQQGSGFGGFGSGNTNTGGFGQPTSGAGFGSSTTGTTGGFGGFGSGSSGFGSNNTTNTTSLFGAQNKPAFGSTTSGSGGGGLFGSGTATTGNSGGFGAFGSNNNNNQNTGGLFGSTTTSKPAFGGGSTGGGLFGSPNTGFGTTNNQSTGAFGSAPFGQGNATCEGTGSTPFSAYTEKEGTSNITNHYQSVSFMAPYKNWSFEELRLADYNGGRRHGNGSGQAGAFGSTNFGAFGQQNNTSGGFGQPTTTSAGGIFGNTTTQAPSGFGTQQTSSFGGNNNSSSTGLFGAPKPAGSGLFGSTTSAGTSGGLFGTAGGSGTSGTGFGSGGATNGLFGQQNNQQQNKGLFGSTGGGGFGSNTGFGSTNTQTGTNAFGSGTQNNSSPFGQSNNTQASNPFGAFTQPNQTQNQPQNQTQNQTSTSNPFGAFGAQNQEQKPGGIFGNPSTTNTNTGGGIFGPQTNNNQASGGLFGQSGTNQNSGSSLFGQKPATGGGLFGQANNNTANTGSGLFSGFSNQPQNQPQQSQGGGSSAPTTANKSLPGGGGLFSNTGQQQQTTGGGGLFGNNTNNNAGSSLFGSSQQQQQQPNPPNQFQPAQTLHTSIVDPNAFGSPSIFSGLPPPPQVSGPIATPISQKPKQKKSALLPYYKLTPNGASSRFQTPSKRGYGFSYSTYGTPGSASSNASTPGGLGGSLLYSSVGRGLGKSLSTSNLRGNYGDADSILTPGAFSANSSRYGGAGSMKKLTIDRSLRTDLFGDKGNSAALPSPEKERQSGILKKKVSFDASTVGGNGEQTNGVYVNGAVNGSSSNTAGPSTDDQGIPQTPRSQSKPKSNAAPQQLEMEQVRGNELAIVPEDEAPEAASAAPQRASVPKPQEDQEPGAYWMKPTKEQIQKMSKEQRSEISGFVVGRQGCGKVEFNKPVDLSNINLNDIFDNIVVIVVRTLTVYPETTQKPPLGKGLNVPSTLYLENSWPRQRDRVLPRYEKNGRHFDKHVERLRRVGDTTFVRYERDTGTWIFKVPHFTTYGFDYEDDTSDNESLHLNDSVMTEPPETPTPKSRTASGPTPKLPKASQHAPTKMKRAFQPDEAAEPINGRYLPGAFEDVALNDMDGLNVEMEEIDDEEFLSDERSAASPSESGGDEPSDIEITEGEINGQSVGVRDENQDLEMAGTFPELEKDQPDLGGEKAVLDVSGDWAYDLQQTIRPRKQDRQALRTAQTQQVKDKNVQTSSITDASARPAFATSIDLMNSLFGQSPPKGEKPFGSLGQKGVKSRPSNSHRPPDIIDVPLEPGHEWLDLASELRAKYPSVNKQIFNAPHNTLVFQKSQTTFSIKNNIPMATTRQAPFNDFYQAAQPVSAYERSVWGLAAILFDDQDSTTYGIPKSEQGKYDARIRKDRLAAFWQQICEEEAETNARELQSAEERAIAFLSANKVGKACETLLQSKNYRLATLIAQIGNNGTMHTEIASQISTWRDLNVLSEISEPIRALYSLLAAQTCTCEGKKAQHIEDRANTFSISERFNLDWKRAFGLRLYYAIETNDPIEVAVAAFAEDIKNDEPKKPGDDLLYALLQVYAASKKWLPFPSLAHILLPQTQEPSALTARLSFQLYCALTGRFPDSADSTVADTISTQFAVQLDAAGEWLWALFALIHISDPTNREQRIKALLAHHAGDLVADPPHDDRWKDIIDIYKVPETWLYQAKALRARAVDHDRLREAGYLVKAEQWVDAHEVLKRVVGPDCVIAEEWDKLQGLLTAFRTSKEKIRGWELGGQVYADYWGIVTEATGGREKGKVLKGLMECLPALLRDVEKGRESEGKNEKELFREMVALEEMKRVTEREVAVMEEQGSDGR